MTDFFGNEDRARAKSGKLIFLFFLSLVGTVAATCGAAFLVLHYGVRIYGVKINPEIEQMLLHDPRFYLYMAVPCAILIGGGALFKILQLRSSGGVGILNSFEHELVSSTTEDPKQKMLLDVVQEMSLASGVPMPHVAVLLNEPGINAFAAGFQPKDTVIAVSQGALENLSRDELQGVVGHEFSHILNQDMDLNLKTTGAIYGLLLITLLGRILTNSATSSSRSSSRDRGDLPIIFLGLGLILAGLLGRFFASLIQAALSRQREYLADASSVQFTRNPRGIGGALMRIWKGPGSALSNSSTLSMSHFYFAEDSAFRFWMATHPPLPDRIRAVDPDLLREDAAKTFSAPAESSVSDGQTLRQAGVAGFAEDRTSVGIDRRSVPDPRDKESTTTITAPATETLQKIPESVRYVAYAPKGAHELLFGLLLHSEADVLEKQKKLILADYDQEILDAALKFARELSYLDQKSRFLCFEFVIPAYRKMNRDEEKRTLDTAYQMLATDHKINLFELLCWATLTAFLAPEKAYEKQRSQDTQSIAREAELLLRLIAKSQGGTAEEQEKAFLSGYQTFWNGQPPMRSALPGANLKALEPKLISQALDELRLASPQVRATFMRAASQLAKSHKMETDNEWVLLRAFGLILGMPVPI